VPRSNPLSPRERGICDRLREARLHTKLSRVAFCTELSAVACRHLDATTYTNYEQGKARLPYWVAAAACKRFGFSPCWLAERLGPMHYSSVQLQPKVSGRELFSAVYDEHFTVFRELLAAFLPGAPMPTKRKRTQREQLLVEAEYAAMRKETLELIADAFDAATEQQKIALVDKIHLALHEFSIAYPGVSKFRLPTVDRDS
jgi:hypothetical protein